MAVKQDVTSQKINKVDQLSHERRELLQKPDLNAKDKEKIHQLGDEISAVLVELSKECNPEEDKFYFATRAVFDTLAKVVKCEDKISKQVTEDKFEAAYQKWLDKELRSPIADDQLYNVEQVKYLTEHSVPQGKEGLESYFETVSEKDMPASFVWYKPPSNEKGSPTYGHFIALHISDDKITYLDPNGREIDPELKTLLQKQFPDKKMVYLDTEGNELSLQEGKRNPERILQVQPADNNRDCGMWASELALAMKVTEGNEAQRKGALKELKEKDPHTLRIEHEECLHGGESLSDRRQSEYARLTSSEAGKKSSVESSVSKLAVGEDVSLPVPSAQREHVTAGR